MKPYKFTLSRAFSVNDMYANKLRVRDHASQKWVGGGRMRTQAYNLWRDRSGNEMLTQGPRPRFEVPVRVSVQIGVTWSTGSSVNFIPDNFDGDNTLKPICDLLKKMGVVSDDRWQAIPEHAVCVTPDVVGVVVTVRPTGYVFKGKGQDIERLYHGD